MKIMSVESSGFTIEIVPQDFEITLENDESIKYLAVIADYIGKLNLIGFSEDEIGEEIEFTTAFHDVDIKVIDHKISVFAWLEEAKAGLRC